MQIEIFVNRTAHRAGKSVCGNVISNCYVPYSFRIEEIDNGKFTDLYDVDYIFSKPTTQNKYTEITYGDTDTLNQICDEILIKLDINKISKLEEKQNS